MGHFLLAMILLVFSFNSFASHIDRNEDDKEKKSGLTTNDVEILDFEIIEVNEKIGNFTTNDFRVSDFEIVEVDEKMVDEDLLEHHGGDREKPNLNNLSYWYVHAPAPLRLFILFLGNGETVHPLAGSIFKQLLAYRKSSLLEKSAAQKDAKQFFDLALAKHSSSFFRERQKSTLSLPSEQELRESKKYETELKALELKRQELSASMEKKRSALNNLEGKTAEGEVFFVPYQAKSLIQNQQGIRKFIIDLESEAEPTDKKIKELNEKKQSIDARIRLVSDQEELLTKNQNAEALFIREPKKLEDHLQEKFGELTDMANYKDTEALNSLGLCHFWGWGCDQDYMKAFTYFLQATIMDGNPKAHENLGFMYEGGFGVERDLGKAFDAYNKFTYEEYTKSSIDQSNGFLHLAYFNLTANGTEHNFEAGLDLLRLAVEHKNPIALRALAQLDTSIKTYLDFSKMMEEFDERVNDSLREAEYSKLLERINKGDVDAYHSFGKYFLGERPCNYFQVALSFAIGYLEEDVNFLKFIEPVLFSEKPIYEVSLYHQDDLRLREFKKFIKNFNISILVGRIMDDGLFKGLKKIVRVKLSQAAENDKTLNDGLRYPSFQSVYRRACDGDRQYRRILGYYYLFGLEQDADIKKSALLFSLADSPLSNQNWKKKIDDFLNPTKQEEKIQIGTSLEHEENCDKLDSKDLPASFEWHAELAGLGYPIGFYEMAKIIKEFSPSLAKKYLLQAGQHPKVTSELSTIKRDIPGVKA